MDLCQIIRDRKSCRAFLNRDVELSLIEKVLEVAKWAPSGVNHQPAKVAVLKGEWREKVSAKLREQFDAGISPNPDYEYCPKSWPDPYKSRRKACGLALYHSLGISSEDTSQKKKHWGKNYSFFDAPIGLIIYMDQGMPTGSWIDVGMFIQNILLAAKQSGLASCPQAAIAEYPDIVRETLKLEAVDIVCGIALGYEDEGHPLNSYRTDREPVDGFTKWYVKK